MRGQRQARVAIFPSTHRIRLTLPDSKQGQAVTALKLWLRLVEVQPRELLLIPRPPPPLMPV